MLCLEQVQYESRKSIVLKTSQSGPRKWTLASY